MPGDKTGLLPVLRSRAGMLLTVALLAQAAAFYALPRSGEIALPRPLREFPRQMSGWTMSAEGVIEENVLRVLKADDTLNRNYSDQGAETANVFVAFFRSQSEGRMPHSPKNCLPGAGWVPLESGIVPVTVPGVVQPIYVNRYVITKGESRSVVYYWYQSRERVVASEYWAKLYLVLDSIRLKRTETAIVRVTVSIAEDERQGATRTAERFVQVLYPLLRGYLPA